MGLVRSKALSRKLKAHVSQSAREEREVDLFRQRARCGGEQEDDTNDDAINNAELPRGGRRRRNNGRQPLKPEGAQE